MQKGGVLNILEESNVNDVIGRHVIDGYGFNDGGRHVSCEMERREDVKNKMGRRMGAELWCAGFGELKCGLDEKVSRGKTWED